MPSGFYADPDYIAAYSQLADDLSNRLHFLGKYADDYGCARSGFDGVMSFIEAPVDSYATSVGERIRGHSYTLYDTMLNLRKAAWMYAGAEEDAYLRIRSTSEAMDPRRGPTPLGPYGATYPTYYSTPHGYSSGVDLVMALDPPAIQSPDLQAKVKEVGGVLYGL